jgi:hypothetical protein
MIIEGSGSRAGSGSGSIPLTSGSGSGSGRPKKHVDPVDQDSDPAPQHWCLAVTAALVYTPVIFQELLNGQHFQAV